MARLAAYFFYVSLDALKLGAGDSLLIWSTFCKFVAGNGGGREGHVSVAESNQNAERYQEKGRRDVHCQRSRSGSHRNKERHEGGSNATKG